MNRVQSQLWNFYVRGGTAFVARTARTQAGFYLSIDPVDVVSVSDGETLRRAIKATLELGNPEVRTPGRDDYSIPVVVKYAKVKSLSAFEKSAQLWEITVKDGIFQIQQMRRRSDGCGFEDDPEKAETLLPYSTVDEVTKRVVVRVQAAQK